MSIYYRFCILILAVISLQVSATSTDATYRVAEENWGASSQLIEDDPEWAAWVTRKQNAFDNWSNSFQEDPSRKIGWGHELYNKSTGKMERWNVLRPNPSLLEERSEKYKAAWLFFSRMHNFKMILEASRLYRLTGRAQYLNWAKEQILFYAQNYQRWPLQNWNGKARMMTQSLDEAVIVIQYLIPSLRLLKEDFSRSELSRVHNQLLRPIQKNLSTSKKGVNNIAVWHAVAKVLIALELKDYSRAVREFNERTGLLRLLKSGIKDGIWQEGSFGYNNYVLRALSGLLVEGGLRGVSAELGPLYQAVNVLLVSPTKFRFDDFSLPNSNNSRKRQSAINLSIYKLFARVVPTKAGVAEHQRNKGWELLLDPLQHTNLNNSLLNVKSAVYKNLRMAVLKSDSWQVFIHYAQATRNHAHHEASNYELYYKNIPLVKDQGTVSYGSGLHKKYYIKPLAHNIPFIDEMEPPILLKPKRINLRNEHELLLEYRRFNRSNVDVRRKYSIKNGYFSDVVSINFAKNYTRNKKIGMMFHTECQITVPKKQNVNIRNRTAIFPVLGAYIKPMMTLESKQKKYQTTLLCKGVEFDLTILSKLSADFTLIESPSTTKPYKRLSVYSESIGGNNTFTFILKKK